MAVSGIAVERAATPALRLLEGYWPSWARPLRQLLADWLARRAAAEAPEWQAAYARVQGANPSAEDFAVYARLERRRRRRRPANPGYHPHPDREHPARH